MLSRINRDVLGVLFKSQVEGQTQVREQRQITRAPQPKLQTSRTDNISATGNIQPNYQPNEDAPAKPQQVKGVIKVGRNDPCPCGSGKKFKQCHGKDE